MVFADLHCHALFGVDDGAKTEADMRSMVDDSYDNGVRFLWLTPHFHPGYYGNNRQKADDVFRLLRQIAAERYPGLQLFQGNELYYSRGCAEWLHEGLCRTMGDTVYVLVDFHENEDQREITDGLFRLLNAGYQPILAHPERYRRLSLGQMREYRDKGVLLQLDVQSILGGFGLREKIKADKLLREGLADFVGSDAHNCNRRSPILSIGYDHVVRKYGMSYAKALFRDNALELLLGQPARKDVE